MQTARPNELWEIDLIGRIQGNNQTDEFIFVAIDHYTNWIEAKIIKQKTVVETANAIKELVV